MNYYTADPHFSHNNIIKYCNRPFHSFNEMDATLLSNINSVVDVNDHLWVLGDFTFAREPELRAIRDRINCKNVHLVLGNHDRRPVPHNIFASVCEFKELTDSGFNLTLCHYPLRCWNRSHHNSKTNIKSIHLYGHVHGTVKPERNTAALDIGVDVHNFYPLNVQQIHQKILANYD